MFTTIPPQERFRSVNEEILRQSRSRSPFATLDFICECCDPHCYGVLPLSISRFERLRSAAGMYAVLGGHLTKDVETRQSAARSA